MREIKIITDPVGAAYIHTELEELLRINYSKIKTARPEHIESIKSILKQIEDQVGANKRYV